MDQVLPRPPHTHCYLDDILVSGPDKQTHLKTLDAVLGKRRNGGIWLAPQTKEVPVFPGVCGIDAAGLRNHLRRYVPLWKHQHQVMLASYILL